MRRLAIGLAIGAAAVVAACSGSGTTPVGGGGTAAAGQRLAQDNGCVACHSADGSSRAGPTWKDLYGSTVKLQDGKTVVADEAYLRRAIQQPNAEVVEGFAPTMPGNSLAPAQVDQLVDYLKSLSATGASTSASR
jgi:cytochrome c oxidase subunit II